jgi:hypothetical protein
MAKCKAHIRRVLATAIIAAKPSGGRGYEPPGMISDPVKAVAETAKTEKALEARLKQCAEADSRLVGLGLEANRLLGVRAEAETMMSKIRSQLGLV